MNINYKANTAHFMILSFLILAGEVFGQLPEKPINRAFRGRKYNAGFMFGTNFSKFVGRDLAGIDIARKVNFRGGFVCLIDYGSKACIEADFIINQKGTSERLILNQEEGVVEEVYYSIVYLEVAPLILLDFARHRKLRPFILAGPEMGIKMGAKVTTIVNGIGSNYFRPYDVEKMEIGCIFGTGALYEYGKTIFKCDIRYERGLTNVFRAGSSLKAYNSVVSIILCVNFKTR